MDDSRILHRLERILDRDAGATSALGYALAVIYEASHRFDGVAVFGKADDGYELEASLGRWGPAAVTHLSDHLQESLSTLLIREGDQSLPLASSRITGSLLVAPIRLNESIIGILRVESDDPEAFRPGDVELLEQASEMLATILSASPEKVSTRS